MPESRVPITALLSFSFATRDKRELEDLPVER